MMIAVDNKVGQFGMAALSQVRVGVKTKEFEAAGRLFVDQHAKKFLMAEIKRALSTFSMGFFGVQFSQISDIVDEFFDTFLLEHMSLKLPSSGSTSIGGLLTIFSLAKIVAPDIVVESGVFVGGSTHALRKAAPNARIYCYDVNFAPRKYVGNSVKYFESDWSEDTELDATGGFAFFDDHINNARRVIEASQRGMKYLLFDDAPYLGELFYYRYPGVPTIPMIIDATMPSTSVEWVVGEETLRYNHDAESCAYARELIESAAPVANLRHVGLDAGHKWIVRLR